MNGKVGRHMKINRRSQRIKKYRAMHRQKKKWLTAVAWLAAVVLLCTTYMPVMPAFTLEADQTLSCTYEAHRHNDSCFDSDGNVTCGYADYVVHTHDLKYCYDKDGNLICPLAEVKTHEHSASCYTEQPVLVCREIENSGHLHDESCYTDIQGELICEITDAGHEHNAECYSRTRELTCGMEESPGHVHSGECYGTQQTLICGKEEILPHTHTEDCRDENGALICGRLQVTEHQHGEECFKRAVNEIALTQTEGAKQVTLPDGNTAYPGEKQADGSWVAYDAEYSETPPPTATVKATVTLPAGVEAPEGYRLFIRRVSEREIYYPTEQAVKEAVSEYNDFQCFRIRWVAVDENGKSDVKKMDEVLGQRGNVTIKIEYTGTGDERLKGPAGARKLLVYNSNEDGTLKDTLADLVENVTVDGDFYTGFTFHTSEAGPYVFVSKKLEQCYVEALMIQSVEDGSKPFDNSNIPGNDSSPNNRIVRSYDTIQYNLEAKFAARDQEVTNPNVTMYFELTLSKSVTSARFDTGKMVWLGENYSIEYLDSGGNVIMVEAHNGNIYEPLKDEEGNIVRDENGFARADMDKKVSTNSKVNGSESGPMSYKVAAGTGIAKQRLVGWTELSAKEGQSILVGTQNFSAAIEVRNADHGEVFLPTFRMWLEGNEENYGSETLNPDNTMAPATPKDGNRIEVESGSDYAVTVSAGTNFNLQLKKNGDMSYKSWFDFSTGREVDKTTQAELDKLAMIEGNRGKADPAEFVNEQGNPLSEAEKEKYKNYRYGRMTCYGVTLQLYNATDNQEAQLTEKKMKGLSLPIGEISFDLNFQSNVTSGGQSFDGSDTEYTPILWEYNENVPANSSYSYTYKDPGMQSENGGTVTTPKDGLGNSGRNLYWDYEERSSYAKGAAPSSFPAYHDGCYNGGAWQLKDDSGDPVAGDRINQVAGPTAVRGTGADTSYHFSVSGYDFDFDDYYFPLRDAGNSGNVTGYDSYIRCFSAGCVQVLNVFPRVQEADVVDNELTVKVSNLKLTTRAGQSLEAQQGDATQIGHEANQKDNSLRDKIDLYKPGNMTKGNAFNGLFKDRQPNTVSEGFLGTDYWTTAYDCSAFAGDDIWIMSYGMRSSGGDYRTRAMNLLQLFDSRALSIRDKASANQEAGTGNDPGRVSFLYAADPDYPEGYDTNAEGVLAYMNTVREEDLVYSTDMPDEEGYIQFGSDQTGRRLKCIGVLMEIRDCDLLGGKYQYMRIPVKINGEDEDLVGKTVATVNAVRVWSNEGDMQGVTWANGRWDETKGKNELTGYVDQASDGSAAELANKGNLTYVKTEYEDGTQKAGTHAGGTLAGNSLLILGYKANVNIGVDNKPDTAKISYNQGSGETTVNYRLKNIKTEVSDKTSQISRPLTTLTVRAVLDRLNSGDKQRISIFDGTYRMNGTLIGNDPENPTKISFESGGETYEITVYAALDPTGQSVSFVIGDAPVGMELPDITFDAQFSEVTALKENDDITTSVYISGEGDNRAYDKAKGNMDDITVYVVLGGGTNLTKSVDVEKIDLGGTITYTVKYTNSGTETLEKVYFYDLLPFSGDIRDSRFTGDVILRSFNVTSSDSLGGVAQAQVYYSTIEYNELYDKVSVFGGTKDAAGNVTGMNETAVETMLAGEPCEHGIKFFEPLGKVNGEGEFKYDSSLTGVTEQRLSEIRGVYVKAEKLNGGQTITMTFTVKTKGNEPGDWYRNVSNSWIVGSKLPPLTSNRVGTVAVGRRISGVVWYDKNLNGIRDDNEKLLDGVEVTLFKKNTETGKYEICKEVVDAEATGSPPTNSLANPVDTASGGAYTFDRLAAGDYIVAFSGEKLKSYTGATAYQQNGKNDSDTSDGQVVDGSQWEADGIDKDTYAYYIKYSLGADEIKLHTIKDIRKGTVALKNNVEDFRNQDLGLVISGPQMPDTGGPGTLAYIGGGMLLMIFAGSAWGITRRRKHSR